MNNEIMEMVRTREALKKLKAEYQSKKEHALDTVDEILTRTNEPLTAREISTMTGLTSNEVASNLLSKDGYKFGVKTFKERYCLLTDEGPDTSRVITFRRKRLTYKKR